MLESLAKSSLPNDSAIRAALYLARDHGRTDLLEALGHVAKNPKRDALRGLAAAALYDAGGKEGAMEVVEALEASRLLIAVAWGGILRAKRGAKNETMVTEASFRRLQLGWVE